MLREIRCLKWGHPRWRCWFRYCVTIRKVTGSIPDGIIEIFHWINPSSYAMALEPNQPLTGMCIRLVSMPDKFTTFMCRLSRNLGASNSWKPQVPSRPVQGLLYHVWTGKMKGKVVPVCALEAYSLLTSVLDRWMWMVNFTLRRFTSVQETRYPLSRKPCGPHCQSGRFSR